MTESNLPDPKSLAEAFAKDVWEPFGNVTSPALIKAWSTLFKTFNHCIRLNKEGLQPVEKQVISLPTGSGKSQATRFYMRNLQGDSALIVTSFIKEADETVEVVNCDEYKAKADHSGLKSRRTNDEINNTQILVITHSQYLNSLQDPKRLKALSTYHSKPRDLYIIDESLTQVDSNQIDLSQITTAISKIAILSEDNEYRLLLENEKNYLKQLKSLMSEDISAPSTGILLDDTQKSKIYSEHGKLSELSKFTVNPGKKTLEGLDITANKDSFDSLILLIDNLRSIQKRETCYLSSLYGKLQLNSVDWLSIEDHHSVILDATADVNLIYKLHDDVTIIPFSQSLRSYSNCNLYLSTESYNLGEESLKKINQIELMEHLRDLIYNIYPPTDCDNPPDTSTNKILLIVHKSIEKILEPKLNTIIEERYELDFIQAPEVIMAHWGDLTGKNDYKDIHKVIILGMFYKPDHYITNLHITSSRRENAISTPDKPTLSPAMLEERADIENSSMAAEIIQAINRVRCRSTIDTEGNCLHTDIYIFKPIGGKLLTSMIQQISKEMQGIKISELSFMTLPKILSKESSDENRGRPTDENDERFIKYVSSLDKGIPHKTSDIKKSINSINKTNDKVYTRIYRELADAKDNYDDSKAIHRFQREHRITITGKNRGKTLLMEL